MAHSFSPIFSPRFEGWLGAGGCEEGVGGAGCAMRTRAGVGAERAATDAVGGPLALGAGSGAATSLAGSAVGTSRGASAAETDGCGATHSAGGKPAVAGGRSSRAVLGWPRRASQT